MNKINIESFKNQCRMLNLLRKLASRTKWIKRSTINFLHRKCDRQRESKTFRTKTTKMIAHRQLLIALTVRWRGLSPTCLKTSRYRLTLSQIPWTTVDTTCSHHSFVSPFYEATTISERTSRGPWTGEWTRGTRSLKLFRRTITRTNQTTIKAQRTKRTERSTITWKATRSPTRISSTTTKRTGWKTSLKCSMKCQILRRSRESKLWIHLEMSGK